MEIPSFSVKQVVKAGSLAVALSRLVLRSPELEPLRDRAKSYAKRKKIGFDKSVGLLQEPRDSDFPMLSLSGFTPESWDYEPPTAEDSEIGRVYFGEGLRGNALSRYEDALRFRALTLIRMLQRKEVIGWGHTADGSLTMITQPSWENPNGYIKPETGDLFYIGDDSLELRWRGVILLLPGERPEGSLPRIAERTNPSLAGHRSRHGKGKAESKGFKLEAIRQQVFRECYKWLRGIMAASPKLRTMSKKELWADARLQWGENLSRERFEDARKQAAKDAKAFAWRAAGALRRK